MSIPYVIDGETDLDSTTINRWIENINTVPLGSITGALEGYGPLANMRAGELNLLDAGAVGDGVSDDTAAIQAALASGTFSIWVPPDKDFVISSTVTGASNLVIRGVPGRSRIHVQQANSHGFNFSGKDNWTFDGVTLIGRTAKDGTDTNQAGIYCLTGNNIHIQNCSFSYLCGAGVILRKVDAVWLQNNYAFENYHAQDGADLAIQSGRNCVVTGNICTSNVTTNIDIASIANETEPGGHTGQTQGHFVIANNITNCIIRGTEITSGYIGDTVGPVGYTEAMKHRRGIGIAYNGGVSPITVVGNQMSNGAWNGLYCLNGSALSANSGPFVIANNIVTNFGFGDPGVAEVGLYGGIYVSGIDTSDKRAPAVITGNVIKDGAVSSTAFAIRNRNHGPVVISSNVILNSHKGISDDEGGSNCKIVNNHIEISSVASGAGIAIVATSGNVANPCYVDITHNTVRFTAAQTGNGGRGIMVDTTTTPTGGFVRVTDNHVEVNDNSGTSYSVYGIHYRNELPAMFARNFIKGFQFGLYLERVLTALTRGTWMVRDNRLSNITYGIVSQSSVSDRAVIVPALNNTFTSVTNRFNKNATYHTILEIESYNEATGNLVFRNSGIPSALAGFISGDMALNTTVGAATTWGWVYDGSTWRAMGATP